MDYECITKPADRLGLNAEGVGEPLCNECKAPDCTNPIRKHTVCVMGVTKTWRLWTVNNSIREVVACKGYTETGQPNVFRSTEA